MSKLKNTFRRLEKIRATIDQLLVENQNLRGKLKKRDEPLVAKVRRLENEVQNLRSLHGAQERVLKSLQDKLDKYEAAQ